MIGTPNTGLLRAEVTEYLMKTFGGNDYNIRWVNSHTRCNENNYQNIAKIFWESDCEWLLQMDYDNPPIRDPLELINCTDKDIIGFPTPIWRGEYIEQIKKGEGVRSIPCEWNVYKELPGGNYSPLIRRTNQFQEIDALGAGCLLIHRRVFDSPVMRSEAWHRVWNKTDGTQDMGLDFAFCKRARSEGFKVWVHWGYPCNHFHTVNLLEVMLVMLEMCKRGEDSGENVGARVTVEEIKEFVSNHTKEPEYANTYDDCSEDRA